MPAAEGSTSSLFLAMRSFQRSSKTYGPYFDRATPQYQLKSQILPLEPTFVLGYRRDGGQKTARTLLISSEWRVQENIE